MTSKEVVMKRRVFGFACLILWLCMGDVGEGKARRGTSVKRSTSRRCYCTTNKQWPGRDFWRSYARSHTVVRAKVLAQYIGCPRYCKTREMVQKKYGTGTLIRVYLMYLRESYKGRQIAKFFYLQTYADPDLCGMLLFTGQTYLLFARDGNTLSQAGNYHYGVGVISSCEGNRNVLQLNYNMEKFLRNQRK
eukprot:gb/GEZJ01005392.1/.p1 GENE.gb/GEZJ01005392.1/~~gb/GEZJ01005392.1/.p1  ORF type:complete len:191 (-),score=8.86 gb/GEZJ01005392.1/:321-893(-)